MSMGSYKSIEHATITEMLIQAKATIFDTNVFSDATSEHFFQKISRKTCSQKGMLLDSPSRSMLSVFCTLHS